MSICRSFIDQMPRPKTSATSSLADKGKSIENAYAREYEEDAVIQILGETRPWRISNAVHSFPSS